MLKKEPEMKVINTVLNLWNAIKESTQMAESYGWFFTRSVRFYKRIEERERTLKIEENGRSKKKKESNREKEEIQQ